MHPDIQLNFTIESIRLTNTRNVIIVARNETSMVEFQIPLDMQKNYFIGGNIEVTVH